MVARYTERAVDALHTYVSTNYATQLRDVETDQGLDANSLTDPVAYLKFRAPFDNRSPLVQIYEEGWRFEDQRNNLLIVDCAIEIMFHGATDLASGELRMRRYLTALYQTIAVDPLLNDAAVTGALWLDGAAGEIIGDTSATRHIIAQGIQVRVKTSP